MAREGHEHRSKHREEAHGSSSQGPSAQPKSLAKRRRPGTLREESSREDSPPRCGTPNSPKEYECLKIRPPVAYTNWKVVNYNKMDPRNIIMLCDRACYSSANEMDTNERFWTLFHQDWYHTILYRKAKPLVPA
jgi:hypothetical protein